jgi:hypothetical protein
MRWKCAIINDHGGDIMIGTNGDILRIRRAGLQPVEVKLLDCQNTPKNKMERIKFDVDPLFHSVDEMKAYMEAAKKQSERLGKTSLQQTIHALSHGLTEDKK